MIHDVAAPPTVAPAAEAVERHGVFYTSARWTPDAVERLVAQLADRGRDALDALPADALRSVWDDTVREFLDPRSDASIALRPTLARFSGLSPAGLDAALAAVLGGVRGAAARSLFSASARRSPEGLVAVFLAGNLPALAVQPLLAALAVRRPVLLKSPSSEPLFAPAFVRALHRRSPELVDAVAAICWRGGDVAIERPVLAAADTVAAYGDRATLDSLAARAAGRCLEYGPRASVAVVGADRVDEPTAAGLAADIALLDQRGCLSVQAIYTDGDGRRLADLTANALSDRARRWPPGPPDPVAASGVHQLRADARMRGLYAPSLDLLAGTVVVEPLPRFEPSPGMRTVRIHPLPSLAAVVEALAPASGRLQGAALAGSAAWELEPRLQELGLSRCAPPGALQSPDALWHNGGVHPIVAFGGTLETT